VNYNYLDHNAAKGHCLGKKRKLVWLAYTSNLSRRLPEEALERVGQMRLIEIASLVNGVEDRNPLL
jgi:hypothetical protein